MSQPRPNPTEIAAAVEVATAAVRHSADVRKRHGRRRAPTREKQLTAARTRCAEVAQPLRSWLGMAAWGGIDIDDELAMKKIMEKLRYERRQIDKMLA